MLFTLWCWTVQRLCYKLLSIEDFQAKMLATHEKKNVTQYLSWVSDGLPFRSVFNWVSQVIHDHFGCAWLFSVCDWSWKLAPPSQPIILKTKTNPDLVRHVFLHLTIVAFTNWLTMMSSLAPIDWWYYIDWFCPFWDASDTA